MRHGPRPAEAAARSTSTKRWAGAAALGLALAFALLACAGSGCEGASGGPGAGAGAGADAGAEGGPGAGLPEGGGGAGGSDAGCPDPAEGIPSDVPAGWLRAPCVPKDCDIYYAPELSLARPPSPWLECGPGCLELVADWGAPTDRIGPAFGASDGGMRYLGYMRRLSDNQWEQQIVRLPSNEVVFDALSPSSEGKGTTCVLVLDAFSLHLAVLRAMTGVNDGKPENPEVILSVLPGDPIPGVLARHPANSTPLEAVAGDGVWLATYGRKSIYWHGTQPSDEMLLAWKSPDSRLAYALSAANTTAFFSASRGHSSYESYAWDPSGGARLLLPFPDAHLGGACCVVSDGETMVWQQGSGAFDAESGTYERVDVMASPHATQPGEVLSRWLRQSFANHVNSGAAVVGGGYALHREARRLPGPDVAYELRHTLTRLSDGAYWIIPPRPGFLWGNPLYVDGEELALVEGAGKDVFVDAGLHAGYNYGIVRYRIDALGPPTAADAGAP